MRLRLFTKIPVLTVLLLTAACTDLAGPFCVAFCTNTTRIQRQYEDHRDECRELAELKMTNMQEDVAGSSVDKTNKTRLVGMFSDCMNNKAWAVPSPDDKKKAEAAAQQQQQPQQPALEAIRPVPPQIIDEARQRSADCAFARQAADSSMIAKKRAQACDIECEQARRHAPEAPPSPACP